jgi:hypothetical protein
MPSPHAAGDPGFIAWANGVDTAIPAAQAAAIAASEPVGLSAGTKAGLAASVPRFAAAQQLLGTLADVQSIPNLKWLFSPDTGFYSDVAATARQTVDGGVVKCWKDAGPNADNAISATGLTLAAGTASGSSALTIAGSAQRLATTGVLDSTFNAGMTYFVVASNPTLAANEVLISSADGRWYHAWNGGNQGFGAVIAATSMPNPVIPIDIPTAANAVTATKGGVMVECVRYNGPSTVTDHIYDGYAATSNGAGSATALALTGALTLGGLPGGFSWSGSLLAVAVFNRALTLSEIQRVTNYLSAATRAHPRPLVQCIGNSLTNGTGATRNQSNMPGQSNFVGTGYAKFGNTDWPSQLLGMYPSGEVTVRNDSYPGRTNQQIIAEMPRTTMSMFDPAAHSKRIALVWEITNALATNILTESALIDAGNVPQSYTDFVTICTTLRAQGWIVGAFTCTPRSDLIPSSSNPLFYRAYQHINTLIRRNWTSFADFVVDVAADPRIGIPGSELDPIYFIAGNVHMTDEGYRVVSTLAKAELDKWVNSAKSGPVLTKSVAGAVSVTLTPREYGTITTTEGRGIVTLTGALTANISVILPLLPGARATFQNNTTGAFTVTLIGATGTGYAISQNKKAMAYTDGINWSQGTPEL